MPAFQDQQAVQQLLSGLNTMQMQAGLMPGQQPYTGHTATLEMYRQQREAPSPADFSNHIRVQFHNAYAPQASMSPFHSAITPVARNQFAQGLLPPPGLGMGWGMAQQQVQGAQNQWMTGAQTGMGMSARLGLGAGAAWAGRGIGGAVGGFLGGPVGATAGAWAGGLAMPFITDSLMGGAVENMAMLPFRPAIQQRQRSLALQNMSTGFLRTGPELHASGMGLTMTASMDLERNISNMSSNRDFRRDTNNMFNRGDMMRITQLSGQLGMLDQSTNVDQIARDVGKIGRALSSFMKIVEEPDVQQALQMMGRMRQLGMAVPEMTQAASNARTYARMAGVSVQGMLQEGMQGAMVFQQAGMAGATGLQTGMAAAGSASMLAGMLNPRQLNMLGGREGIAANLTRGAVQMADMDALLPGLLRRNDKGTLEVDTDAMLKVSSGQMDINQVLRQSAERMADLGPGSMMQEMSTRRNELRDQMMGAFGGKGAMMVPMMRARQMEATGVASFGASLRMLGLDEQTARTYELANTPEFYRRMQQQQDQAQAFERQVNMQRQRQQTYTADDRGRTRELTDFLVDQNLPGVGQGATTFRQIGRGFRRFANARDEWFRAEFGEEQDAQEIQAMLGGGEMIGYEPAMRVSPEQVERSRAGLSDPRRAGRRYQRVNEAMQEIAERTENVDASRIGRNAFMRNMRASTLTNPLMLPLTVGAHLAVGAYDLAISNPGQQALEEVVMSHETWQNQARDYVGLYNTGDDRKGFMAQRAQDMQRGARVIEQGLDSAYDANRVATIQRASGLTDNRRFADVRARIGASVTAYTREKAGGWLTGNREGFSHAELKRKIADDLVRHGKMTPEEARRHADNDALISDAIRLISPGLDDKVRGQLTAATAAGGDTLAKQNSERGRATADVLADRTKKFSGSLGISSGDLDSAQQKQLAALFAGEGPEADARRMLFQARAMEMSGSAEGVRRATLLRIRVDEMGLTPEQRTEAEAGVRGFTESADRDIMRAAGGSMMRRWDAQDKKKPGTGIDAVTEVNEEGRAGAEGTADIARAAAMEKRFGRAAAEEFRNARARGGSGVQALRAYQKASGKRLTTQGDTASFTEEQFRAFERGELSDADIEGIADQGVQYRVTPIVANANSVNASKAPPETVEARMTDALAQQAQQQTAAMTASFSKFDGSVDKLADASKLLADAAGRMAGAREHQELHRNAGTSKALAADKSMSQGVGSGG